MGKAFGNIYDWVQNDSDPYTIYYKNKIYEKTSSWNYNFQALSLLVQNSSVPLN